MEDTSALRMMNKPDSCEHLVASETNRAINTAANPHKSKTDHLVYLVSSVRQIILHSPKWWKRKEKNALVGSKPSNLGTKVMPAIPLLRTAEIPLK